MVLSRQQRIRSLRRSAENCRALIHDRLPAAVVHELRDFAAGLEAEAARIEGSAGKLRSASRKARPKDEAAEHALQVLEDCVR